MEITFRILLQKPPAAVDYGLQKGKGNNYQIIQKQRSDGSDLTFEFTATTKYGTTNAPDFFGPFIQGPREGRFVYIGIGTYAGDTLSKWSRRLKVPFTGITSDTIAEMMNKSGLLETAVPGTGKDGGPNCATVKPFAGWKLV